MELHLPKDATLPPDNLIDGSPEHDGFCISKKLGQPAMA
jgi:hypothetical protein